MSERYPGGVISKTAPVPTGPYENGTAPGVWTLDQQAAFVKQGIWPLAGNVPPYIEDVFSTWLYTGTNANQTITNGIDLAGKGGMVWTKVRSTTDDHELIDTVRGRASSLESNTTDAQSTSAVGASLTQFNSNGYSLGPNGSANVNENGQTFVSWTFREQPKFFDVVTYTGDGVAGRTVAHNLGSVPGCIIVKQTNAAREWAVYHTSLGNTQYINLNSDGGTQTQTYWNNTSPTSTNFTLGDWGATNQAGSTYVAYLFAHNAGGFGLNGTDNVISCGSVNTPSSGITTVNLGYEPQWLLIKRSDAGSNQDWSITDNMRGFSQTSQAPLYPNTSGAESVTATPGLLLTATGFSINAASYGGSRTFIYIAIRRGPMKVPTLGTSVYNPLTRTGTNAAATVTTGNLPDWVWLKKTTGAGSNSNNYSRLTGPNRNLYFDLTLQEIDQGAGYGLTAFLNTAFTLGLSANGENDSGATIVNYGFSRAPGFLDEVCYTGTGIDPTAYNHNLTVIPELLIIKRRSGVSSWPVFYNFVGSTFNKLQGLNQDVSASTGQTYTGGAGLGGAPTATTFTVDSTSTINGNGSTFVAYLFATCPGVSKVGSYTGTGALQTINCGFTTGARFVLIKRTDSTGDWYFWDSARGIIPSNDPYLLLNATGADVTGTDYVDTTSVGFDVTSTAPAAINASGGTYIFLAIA